MNRRRTGTTHKGIRRHARRLGVALAVSARLFCPAGAGGADAPLPALDAYAGSDACAACHEEKYEGWRGSLHYSVVRRPREDPDAILGDFSSPSAGIKPDDVVFAIGGHWYQRYAVELDGELYVSPRVWSVASQRWETQDAWSWKKKPYNRYCIGCHSTRFDPVGGDYVEHRVGCEACHGPGGDHARSAGRATILNPADLSRDDRDLLCASCHVRGFDPSGTYPYPVAFVPGRDLTRHYQPSRIPDGGSARATFLDTFRRWRNRLGDGPPPGCDVCGIHRESPPESSPAPTVTDGCLECHRFGKAYSAHTRHPGHLDLQCLDCHRGIRPAGTMVSASDIHSPEFFQVHERERVAGEDVKDACLSCHRNALSPRENTSFEDRAETQHWLTN